MFHNYPYFYYITIGLQAICAIHCVRKGNQNKWLWLIIFLPIVGSLIYIFSEMFTGNEMQNLHSGMGSVFFPSGRIKKLESNLRFSETFTNKLMLADAYLDAGQIEKAISLYESCLTVSFTEHEYASMKLIYAYAEVKRYDDIVTIAKQIYTLPQFARSRAHTLYAIALAETGKPEEAEKEFKLLKGRFSNYESRYRYGIFLISMNRNDEARKIFEDIINESVHLSAREKRDSREWFDNARRELKKIA